MPLAIRKGEPADRHVRALFEAHVAHLALDADGGRHVGAGARSAVGAVAAVRAERVVVAGAAVVADAVVRPVARPGGARRALLLAQPALAEPHRAVVRVARRVDPVAAVGGVARVPVEEHVKAVVADVGRRRREGRRRRRRRGRQRQGRRAARHDVVPRRVLLQVHVHVGALALGQLPLVLPLRVRRARQVLPRHARLGHAQPRQHRVVRVLGVVEHVLQVAQDPVGHLADAQPVARGEHRGGLLALELLHRPLLVVLVAEERRAVVPAAALEPRLGRRALGVLALARLLPQRRHLAAQPRALLVARCAVLPDHGGARIARVLVIRGLGVVVDGAQREGRSLRLLPRDAGIPRMVARDRAVVAGLGLALVGEARPEAVLVVLLPLRARGEVLVGRDALVVDRTAPLADRDVGRVLAALRCERRDALVLIRALVGIQEVARVGRGHQADLVLER